MAEPISCVRGIAASQARVVFFHAISGVYSVVVAVAVAVTVVAVVAVAMVVVAVVAVAMVVVAVVAVVVAMVAVAVVAGVLGGKSEYWTLNLFSG